jgi:hypothetical protein
MPRGSAGPAMNGNDAGERIQVKIMVTSPTKVRAQKAKRTASPLVPLDTVRFHALCAEIDAMLCEAITEEGNSLLVAVGSEHTEWMDTDVVVASGDLLSQAEALLSEAATELEMRQARIRIRSTRQKKAA